MSRYVRVIGAVLFTALLCAPSAFGQAFTRLQTDVETGTISANGGSVEMKTDRVGGFGSVKVQTLDSYSGTWKVYCAVDGTNYSTSYELKMSAANSSTVVTSVTDSVGIWDVANAAGCRAIKVIATSGFAASDTAVVISATQSGGSGGGGGGAGGGGGEVTNAGTFATQVTATVLAADQAIASKQAALGTFGTPSSDVISIQGNAAMSPLEVNLVATDGTPLVLAGDAVHDSAAATSGPQLMGKCETGTPDPVDNGDAGLVGIDCVSREVRVRESYAGVASYTRTSAGSTEDEHAVCTAPCVLYSITATNTNAAARYLRCENDTAANTTPGSETVELDLAIPGNTAGAGFTTSFPRGVTFSTALTCWLVTGAADTDVAEVAANEIKVFYTLRVL